MVMAGQTNYPLDDPAPTDVPVSRPRVGSRLWDKLDAIEKKIDARIGGNSQRPDGKEGETPTVTFEPEVDDLPVTSGDPEEENTDEGAGTGEGTANIAYKAPPKFGFPHRRRVEIEA
jgi:hypothetical protein